jgi:hypothetical protein
MKESFMKCTSITVAMMFFLAGPASVLAEAQTLTAEAPAVTTEAPAVTTEAPAVTNISAETAASGTEAATPANPATSHSMHKMGMMHKGQPGQGDCGMMHGGGQPGKGMQAKHDQVLQRLDMIEARLAKIEAMLESLVRR